MRIVVVGGAGAMARVIDRDLAAAKEVEEVVVADLHEERVANVVKGIGGDKLRPAQVDVRDAGAMKRLLKGADVAVNSTWYQFNLDVMRACIDAGVHYVDLGGLYRMTMKQLELDGEARDAGVTCLLGMGSTPGTMNVMAAYAAAKFDRIEAVHLRSGGIVLKGSEFGGFVAPYSIRTLLDEFSLPVPVLRDGQMKEIPPVSERFRFSLPDPVGEVEGIYTIHSELATLPKNLNKGVRDMDFAVGFDSSFIDTLATLTELGLTGRVPIPFRGREIVPYEFVAAALDRLPKPAQEALDVDIQRCELLGTKDGKTLRVVVDSVSRPREAWGVGGGTLGTGTPPSIAAQWIAGGRIAARGAVPPEVAVDPLPYFQELHAGGRGIEVYEQVNGGEPRPLFR